MLIKLTNVTESDITWPANTDEHLIMKKHINETNIGSSKNINKNYVMNIKKCKHYIMFNDLNLDHLAPGVRREFKKLLPEHQDIFMEKGTHACQK